MSYVLADSEHAQKFSEDTRRRVIETAGRLGYVRNRAARTLSSGKTHTIALLYTPPIDRFVEKLQLRAFNFFKQRGYLLISVPLARTHSDTYPDLLRSGGCDGALLACDFDQTVELCRSLPEPPILTLSLSGEQSLPHYEVVTVDERSAIEDAITRLIHSGRKRIAFVGQHTNDADVRKEYRWKIFAEIQRSFGNEPEILFHCDASIQDATRQAVRALQAGQNLPDAVYCSSDRVAIGTVLGAEHCGIQVPEHLSVVGSGNSEDSAQFSPQLTTVGMKEEHIDLILEHFWRRLTGALSRPIPIKIQWEVFSRQTTRF